MSTHQPARVNGGVPAGGQFAVQSRDETAVSLTPHHALQAPMYTWPADLVADTDAHAPTGSLAARRRRLAELATFSTWDEATDPVSWQPAVESSSVRFSIKHNADREVEETHATTTSAARAALRGSRSPGRIVRLGTDDTDEVLEVTGHNDDPIQVHLPGFGIRTPLRVTKGSAVIHAGNGLVRRNQAPVVDVTVAPGASVLIFGARGGEVNVTVEGDGAAVVVAESNTATLVTASAQASLDIVGPTSAVVARHAGDGESR